MRWTETGLKSRNRLLFAKARIDNRTELMASLELPEGVSQDAFLLALYEEFGSDCADHLIGDFAFAIWDAARERIYAARDIMGCQPVYFSANAVGFFIAERLEQVHACTDVSRREDEPFIAASLSRSFAHFERTFFAEIRKIAPGHFIYAGPDGVSSRPYWRPEQVQQRQWSNHEECLAEFRELLRKAIADRLPSEGRVGVHVSGGLDCSSIAILTAKQLAAKGEEPIALTWYPTPHAGQSDIEKEEYERVGAVCAAMGVDPVYTDPSAEIVLEVLDRDHRVRPICNASYNEQPVLEYASTAGVTIILSGFGGDEAASFDGRGYVEELAAAGRWKRLSRFSRINRQGSLRHILGRLADNLAYRFATDDRLRALHEDRLDPGVNGLLAYVRLLSPDKKPRTPAGEETRSYLHRGMSESVDSLPRIPVVRTPNTRAARCNLLRWSGLMTRIESSASDAAPYGIEYAYPLLDRRIIEFALALPSHVFRNEQWKRLFFRQAMDPILPEEVCWREIKEDPARVTPLLQALKQAFAIIGERYADGKNLPARSRYVDMERLIRDLEPDALKKRSRIGRIWSAVEFVGAANTPSKDR